MKKVIKIKESALLKEYDSKKLRYNIFDFDNNILNMKSKIKLLYNGKPVQVSTEEFVQLRNNPEYELIGEPPDYKESFNDFRDDNIFLKHVKEAIRKNKYAPSFEAFKKTLIGGNMFAIVTARGQSSEAIRKAVEYFIYDVLSNREREKMIENLKQFTKLFGKDIHKKDLIDTYLDKNEYIGVSSPEFISQFKRKVSMEQGKKIVIRRFVKRAMRFVDQLEQRGIYKKVSIKVSDDDMNNIEIFKKLIQNELLRKYPHAKFSVYDTSDKSVQGGTKITISK